MQSDSLRVDFEGALGATLAARLEMPLVPPRAYALFAHCFTCSKDILAAARISRGLAMRGVAVLRFDFTGIGNSAGDFANTNFSSNVADLVAAADHLRDHYGPPSLLIGHSLGGAAVLAAAHRIADCRAVATINAPSQPLHMRNNLPEAFAEAEDKGRATVLLGGKRFTITREFLHDLERHRMERCVRELARPLLVVHSPEDRTVPIAEGEKIFAWASQPKAFVPVPGANHLLDRREDAEYVAAAIALWSDRHLDLSGEDDRGAPPPRPHGHVLVRERPGGRYEQDIRAGRHLLKADEPVDKGGADRGPSPYELLLSALGACTSMTIRMVAERKGWPLERVEVELAHRKIDAADCDHCSTEKGKIDQIDRAVRLIGELDDAQRAKLLDIANKCPVHRTLHREIDERTWLIE